MTSLLIDIAIIGIILFCAWRGYKNGLIRGVFGIASLIVAIIVANAASQAYSKEAEAIILPFAGGMIDSTLTEMADNNIIYQPLAHDHDIKTPAFGTAYTALREIGLPEAAAVKIASQVSEITDISITTDVLIEPLAEKLTGALSSVAVFGIAFLIISIAFSVLGNLLGFIFSLPGLKLLDTISGAVFGLIKGIIIVLTISVIIRYFGIFATSTIEKTSLLNYLVTNNIIADRLGF